MRQIWFFLLCFSAHLMQAQAPLLCPTTDRCYTPLLESGPQESAIDIVIMGDGFTLAEQALFNQMADSTMRVILGATPFSTYSCAFNFWRVNVISAESGIDRPGTGFFVNTGLDCRFGNEASNEAERCISSDSLWKCHMAAVAAPAVDHIIVLCNTSEWGGCGGDVLFTSIGNGFGMVLIHELGHTIGHLADEYDCFVCNGSDSNRDFLAGSPGIVFEPRAANLSSNGDPTTVKWRHLINVAPPILLDEHGPADQVYVFEGGGFFRYNLFRPAVNCKMRSAHRPFCLVCLEQLRGVLQDYCSGPCTGSALPFPNCLRVYRPELLIQLPPQFRFRWEIPPCWSCPDDVREVNYRIRLDDLPEPHLLVQVRDLNGNILVQGVSKDYGDSVELSFKALRFEPVTLYTEGKNSQPLTYYFSPRLFVNDKEVPVNEATMLGRYRQ